MIKEFVKILELLGDRLEVCVSVQRVRMHEVLTVMLDKRVSKLIFFCKNILSRPPDNCV